ncbi:Armadillo-type fold [Phytophthora cinnamomi]|uniref:Armadillo-type fold n=1 Tax=Phytophthora cinnamomi TaxID=4785 RepID=UPI003559DE6A|nr:Armadillo-type fold [Phytophthora cinnamomi]
MTQMKTNDELLQQYGADVCLEIEEQRQASLPADGEGDVGQVADDKSAVVLTTEELTRVPEVSRASVDDVVHVLTKETDWLQLYEAVVMLRRIIVHHSEVVASKQVEEFLRPLAIECDSLRSTPSKNGLLACAECFRFLPRSILERPLLGSAHPEVVDVLLRRSVCEKKFLRDAAAAAAEELATHLAGLPLLAAAARYGANKNGKLCGSAAKIIASSLLHMQQDQQSLAHKGSESLRTVYRALAAFRESKDATARAEATASFQRLGELQGVQELEIGLKDALPGAGQAGIVARILKDAFPKTSMAKARPRMGSLRDRMRQDTNARTGTVVRR